MEASKVKPCQVFMLQVMNVISVAGRIFFLIWPLYLFLPPTYKTMHIKIVVNNSIAMIYLKKRSSLAGFEPGSSDPETDAMSTAPRRPGQMKKQSFLGLVFTIT
jgi:hypothetical protein